MLTFAAANAPVVSLVESVALGGASLSVFVRQQTMSTVERCPFKAGDIVRYAPSSRGAALDVMSLPEGKPAGG